MHANEDFRREKDQMKTLRRLGSNRGLVSLGLVGRDYPPLLLTALLLAQLVNDRSLLNALVMAAPCDDGAFGQTQNTFYSFTEQC